MGPGWEKNLRNQFELRKRQGYKYIEIDNADAFQIIHVLRGINIAQEYELGVIAKNPNLMKAAYARGYVEHPNVFGAIVEKGGGSPREMAELRRETKKYVMPIWFVAFGDGRAWANDTAKRAANYYSMGVTYSPRGEYESVIDVLVPRIIGE